MFGRLFMNLFFFRYRRLAITLRKYKNFKSNSGDPFIMSCHRHTSDTCTKRLLATNVPVDKLSVLLVWGRSHVEKQGLESILFMRDGAHLRKGAESRKGVYAP